MLFKSLGDRTRFSQRLLDIFFQTLPDSCKSDMSGLALRCWNAAFLIFSMMTSLTLLWENRMHHHQPCQLVVTCLLFHTDSCCSSPTTFFFSMLAREASLRANAQGIMASTANLYVNKKWGRSPRKIVDTRLIISLAR